MSIEPGTDTRRNPTVVAVAAMVVAVVALVLSVSGFAGAAPKVKGLLTVARGSADLVANEDGAEIELDGAEFIQAAGTTVLLVVELKADLPEFTDLDGDGDGPDACGANVFLGATTEDATEGAGQQVDITNGGLAFPRAVQGLTPSATDLSYTLGANGFASCEADFAEGEAPTIPVEFEVAVLAVA